MAAPGIIISPAIRPSFRFGPVRTCLVASIALDGIPDSQRPTVCFLIYETSQASFPSEIPCHTTGYIDELVIQIVPLKIATVIYGLQHLEGITRGLHEIVISKSSHSGRKNASLELH